MIAVSEFMPEIPGLGRLGMVTAGLLISFLAMLVFEVLPVIVISFIYIGLMPVLHVTPSFGQALSGFSSPVVFFTLASFGIAAAFTATPLSRRILKWLIGAFGKNVRTTLLALMVCAAIVSSIVSNVPTCAIFMAIGLSFLGLYKDEGERRRTGRAFMIGIPVASMIGGMATPAGSSINLLALQLLEKQTGTTVTFVQWMCAGIPLVLVILPVAWLLIVKVYKPAEIDRGRIHDFVLGLDVPKHMESKEKKAVALTLVMLALWIASSWVRSINVMVVALLGCSAMFLPGIDILDLGTFIKENSWDSFFLVGAVISIGSAMVANGVSGWFISLLPALSVPVPVLIAFVVALMFIMLLLIPVATSLVTVMAPALIAIAVSASVPPALVMLAAAICACNCYLLPLDTVTLLTYSKGYYSMTDMAKSTFFLQMFVLVAVSLWLPVAASLCGLI